MDLNDSIESLRALVYGGNWTRAIQIARNAPDSLTGMSYVFQAEPSLCRSADAPEAPSVLSRVRMDEDGAPRWEVVGSVQGSPAPLPCVRYSMQAMLAGAVVTWKGRDDVMRPLHRMTPTHQGHLVYFVHKRAPLEAQWYEAVLKLVQAHRKPLVHEREYKGTEVRVYPEMGGMEVCTEGWGVKRQVSCYRGGEVDTAAVPFLDVDQRALAVRRINEIIIMSEILGWF